MRHKQPDPRSPAKKAKDARYAALPPLRVAHPLRFIDAATGSYVRDAKGVRHWVPSSVYTQAQHAANTGNGGHVQRTARRLAAAA